MKPSKIIDAGDPELESGIEASDLSFSYNSNTIFQDLGFVIPQGQVWALIGRSGIGKSTLLNVILGLYRPTEGCVTAQGRKIGKPGHIRGVVFQDESLYWWLSILENVLFPRHRTAEVERVERARQLLRLAGLQDIGSGYPKQLSTGMRRRAELVRALMIDDRFFVADEPFASLDVQTRLELWSAWRTLRASNARTGIICTHDPVEAAVLCDGVMVMRPGPARGASISVVEIPDRFKDPGCVSLAAFADPFVAELARLLR